MLTCICGVFNTRYTTFLWSMVIASKSRKRNLKLSGSVQKFLSLLYPYTVQVTFWLSSLNCNHTFPCVICDVIMVRVTGYHTHNPWQTPLGSHSLKHDQPEITQPVWSPLCQSDGNLLPSPLFPPSSDKSQHFTTMAWPGEVEEQRKHTELPPRFALHLSWTVVQAYRPLKSLSSITQSTEQTGKSRYRFNKTGTFEFWIKCSCEWVW